MPNEMTKALFHSEWGIQNDDYLQHYGILGMHWGIRRFQPYGEGGYDPDHEGKNIGLAARLAGHTGSYSDAIKRGSSFGNRAKAAASSFGKRAGKAAKEVYERADYAAERVAQGLISGSEKAKKGLAKYSSTYVLPGGKKVQGETEQRMLEKLGTKDLMGLAAKTFASNAKTRVSDMRKMSGDDIKSALGSGASRFQEAMSRTAVKSKEFGRNAAMTAALLGGALDPRSNASQTVQSRFEAASVPNRNIPKRYESPVERFWKDMGIIEKEDVYSDALDLGGRLDRNKKSTALSDTGSKILKNYTINMNSIHPGYRKATGKYETVRSSIGNYSPSDAVRRAEMERRLSGAGISAINQKSTTPRWKGNDGMNTEARKRFATGELAELDSRSPVRPRGSTLTGLATKPYKDYNKTHPDDWRDLQEDHMDYRDRVKPSRFTRDKLTSKIGNMTTEKFNKELEKRGISFAMINQTPVPMIPKGQNNASIRELEKRLGII